METNKKKSLDHETKSENEKDFAKIVKDFTNDILLTFPEYMNDLNTDLKNIISIDSNSKDFITSLEKVKGFILKLYPNHFFNILYQNDEMFKDTCFLLPGINFKIIWEDNISDQTRTTIWKYLQLILFSVIGDVKNQESFGDTAKLFEAINEDELKSKLESTINEMQTMFDLSNNPMMPNFDISNIQNMPNPENIQDHLNGVLGGKLGNLAREIAEETARDLNIDESNTESVEDVFKQLFKNPGKLMNLVKGVGGKLDQKLKSGELKESELMAEAQELMKNMKNMPGMENIQSMMQNMGMNIPNMGKNTRVNYGAMQEQLNRKMRMAKMRENALVKSQEKREQLQKTKELQAEREKNYKPMTSEELEELVFSIEGEKPEKSARNPQGSNNTNAKKKKKKKGKK